MAGQHLLYSSTNKAEYSGDYYEEYLTGRKRFTGSSLRDDSSRNKLEKKQHWDVSSRFNCDGAYSDLSCRTYVTAGVSFASLIAENILCHPFIVMRRQCQVHPFTLREPSKFHLLPFTLVTPLYHLHQTQGLTTLWKGLGSVLLIRGMSRGIEDVMSQITHWPSTVDEDCQPTTLFQHLLLKSICLAIATPFYSASLVETVQSEVASEQPGILDVFKEGFIRLFNWNSSPKGRLIPISTLIVPTVSLGLAKYIFSVIVQRAVEKLMHSQLMFKHEVIEDIPESSNEVSDISLVASLIALISSDVLFYPFETIVHKLHLQGTRTIIDNLDNGRSVLAVLTNYDGVFDCYQQCMEAEGVFGFYKGFGALILQYALHIALVKATKVIFTEIGQIFAKPKPPSETPQNVTFPDISKSC